MDALKAKLRSLVAENEGHLVLELEALTPSEIRSHKTAIRSLVETEGYVVVFVPLRQKGTDKTTTIRTLNKPGTKAVEAITYFKDKGL